MKILVANLGSTSFKYRLFDLERPGRAGPGAGAIERIGSPSAKVVVKSPRGEREMDRPIADHGDAVQLCLDQLTDPEIGVLADAGEVVGHRVQGRARPQPDRRPPGGRPRAGGDGGLRRRRPGAQSALHEGDADAPRTLPHLPLVAAFETGFHRTIPEANQRYAIPDEWATEFGVRRWGFHGASHRYISWRMPELLGRTDIKVISCHLGGSSSLCAIRNGQSVACSLGMSPQSGLPHNNRVGDFDVFALPVLLRETGKSLDEILEILANHSGLEGLCAATRPPGHRDRPRRAATPGRAGHRGLRRLDPPLPRRLPARAGRGRRDRLHRRDRRELVADPLRRLPRPRAGSGSRSTRPATLAARPNGSVSAAGSRVQVWTVPTNEEIVVARQSQALLESGQASST